MLSFQLYIKDHLGNVRAVVNQNDSIEEINHYYPYGSLFGESTGLSNETQPYKYNAKELDRMHGLDLHDQGARWSDTNIGRWHKVDRYAKRSFDTSPYALCGNNPVKYIDETGDTLTLNGEREDVNTTTFLINNELGGYFSVGANEDGLISLTPVSGMDPSQMSESEKVFYDIINQAVTGNGTASINIVNGSADVEIGNISTFSVDIGDVMKIGAGNYLNSGSVLAHEIHEEYLVQGQKMGVLQAHRKAAEKEAKMTGGFIHPYERHNINDIMNLNVRDSKTMEPISTIRLIFNRGNIICVER